MYYMGPFGVATYVKNGLSTIKRELIAQATLCTGRYLTYLWPNDQDSFLRNFFRAFFSLLLFAMNAVFFPFFNLFSFVLFCYEFFFSRSKRTFGTLDQNKDSFFWNYRYPEWHHWCMLWKTTEQRIWIVLLNLDPMFVHGIMWVRWQFGENDNVSQCLNCQQKKIQIISKHF